MLLAHKFTKYGAGIQFQTNCTGISLGSLYDCENPLQAGVEQRLIIFNRTDIDTVTYDVTVTSLITNITLVTGAQGYEFTGVKQSINPQYSLIPAAVSVGYDHLVDMHIWDVSQEQKDNLENMAVTNNLVAVVENINDVSLANSVFEVYGLGRGMEVFSLSRIPGDQESTGAFVVQLKTSDDTGKEVRMPTSWFDTDFQTTKAAVDALLTPAP